MCNRFSFFLNRSSDSHYLHFSPSQQHNCPTWQRHAGRRWRRLHFFRPKRLSGCVSLPFCLLFILSRSCCIQVVVTTCCPSLFSHAYTSMFRFEFNACRQRLHWLVAPSRPSSLGEIRKFRRTIEMLQSHTHVQILSSANVLTAALRAIVGVVILVVAYRCHSKIPKHPPSP